MIHIKRIDEFCSRLNEMAVKGNSFNNYDEFDMFDSKYFIVKDKGLYNLFDRNGNPISDVWFEDIKQNDDGSFSVTLKDKNSNTHTGSYTDTKELEKSIEIQNDVIDNVATPSDIVFTDIIIVEPYSMKDNSTNGNVTIVAKVKYNGEELLLGENGKLYTSDGNEYDVFAKEIRLFIWNVCSYQGFVILFAEDDEQNIQCDIKYTEDNISITIPIYTWEDAGVIIIDKKITKVKDKDNLYSSQKKDLENMGIRPELYPTYTDSFDLVIDDYKAFFSHFSKYKTRYMDFVFTDFQLLEDDEMTANMPCVRFNIPLGASGKPDMKTAKNIIKKGITSLYDGVYDELAKILCQ